MRKMRRCATPTPAHLRIFLITHRSSRRMPIPSPLPFPARPYVSFVLATYNRGPILLDCLQKTLAAALASLGPGHFSISIVDNASTDQTPDLVRFLAEKERHIKYLRLPKNCGPVAKNAALHQNAADLIVLLADDAYPLPRSLPQTARHFQAHPHH